MWHSFENKLRVVVRMKEETNALLGPVSIATPDAPDPDASCTLRLGSATDLSFLPDESVDYIFIDPPWAIKYFDLSVLWCAWMGFSLEFDREIFPWQEEFRQDMERSLRECARLRPAACAELRHPLHRRAQRWRDAVEATGSTGRH